MEMSQNSHRDAGSVLECFEEMKWASETTYPDMRGSDRGEDG